jgi:hypothetical protein
MLMAGYLWANMHVNVTVYLYYLLGLSIAENFKHWMVNVYFFFLCFRSLMARSRQDEVNKKINISNVGIYCHQLEEQHDLYDVGALTEAHSNSSLGLAHPRDDYLINPFCVTVSVLVSASLLCTYFHQ